jgi:hypothetical protein
MRASPSAAAGEVDNLPSLGAPLGGGDADGGGEARRLALLQRLNHIERQRMELACGAKVSFATTSAPDLRHPPAPADAATQPPGSPGRPPTKRARTAPLVADDGPGGSVGTKRRKSDTILASMSSAPPPVARPARLSAPPAHSPAISARAQTNVKPPPTPALDLDPTGIAPLGLPRSSAPRAFLAQQSPAVGGAGSPAISRFAAPGSPTLSGRGTGRVRTPSVLLAKQPGEHLPVRLGAGKGKGKNNQVSFCLRIVKDLVRLKDSHAFSKPIDQLWPRDQLPGYFEMITHPMDLQTIQGKLEKGGYLVETDEAAAPGVAQFDALQFATDMRLVFQNARTYNRPGDMFFEAAGRLTEKFEAKFGLLPTHRGGASGSGKKKEKKEGATSGGASGAAAASGGRSGLTSRKDGKRRKSAARAGGENGGGAASPGGRSAKRRPAAAGGPAGSGAARNGDSEISASPQDAAKMSRAEMEARLDALKRQLAITDVPSPSPSPTPGVPSYLVQAQALYHVPMTFEEKVKLSENVGRLPGDKLQKLVALVSKNTSLTMEVNNDEEIELDIDHMDNKTLRDMEAYVNQTLIRRKGGIGKSGGSPRAADDLAHLSREQLNEEVEKIVDLLGSCDRPKEGDAGRDGACGGGGEVGLKKQKSFYDDSSSSSGSDSSGSSSGSDSSDDSDDGSNSSGRGSEGDEKRKRRELNLEHMRKMGQAAPGGGTPLPSPAYSGANSSMQPMVTSASPSPNGRAGGASDAARGQEKSNRPAAGSPAPP